MRFQRTATVAVSVALASLLFAPAASAQDASKPAVVRDGDQWLLRDSLSGGPATESFRYGRSGDYSLLCDWNGDGVATPGVVRHGRWMLRNSRSGGVADVAFTYGRDGDMPVCGDWNGDGAETPGVVRESSTGLYSWYLRNSLSGGAADLSFAYGRDTTPGELPPSWVFAGDWDGDGVDTPGIVRGYPGGEMRWLLTDVNHGGVADYDFWYYDGAVWGDHLERHSPVVGDWNDDGRDGPGVVHASGAVSPQWLLRNDRSAGFSDVDFRYGSHFDVTIVWE